MFEQQGSHILQEKKIICWTYFLRQSMMLLLKLFMALLLNSTGHSIKYLSYLTPINPDESMRSIHQIESMTCQTLRLDGHLNFTLGNTYHAAASDFGNRIHLLPAAVLYPKSVSDISSMIKCVYDMGTSSELTIAARGHGHSLQGQAQAENGIVISMESLTTSAKKMQIHYTGKVKDKQAAYVDVSGGDLWINILKGTLKHGFSPKSWTDYLHLTVGGTLSNAGISGQAFRHGPQINNVCQLEVVTGTGDVVMCSEKQNADLFYGVLGGLGQFGIITKARIAVELAPTMVKWIRVLYSDFHLFTKDQEQLISLHSSFDYIEGFVIINRTSLLYNWRLTFNPKDPLQVQQFSSEGRTLYCLEMAKYYNPEDSDMAEGIEDLLSRLNYIQHTLFQTDVPYIEFLDRVHSSEVKLKEKGLWDVPHPWLNLLVPKSKIHRFAQEVFGNILTDNGNGPILLYPVNQSRWSKRISMVTPEEDVFYLVAFLSSAVPSSAGSKGLEHILSQNQRILDYCEETKLGVKQYLARHGTQEDWRAHFGPKWKVFARRKSEYDPLAILAPGQGIFQKASNILGHQSSLQVQDT